MDFAALPLKRWIVDALRRVGITRMSEAQRAALPDALRGASLLVNSRTGTGKTLVYLLPVLQLLAVDPCSVAAVVVLPSRELALHVFAQFEFFGAGLNLRCALLTGGQGYSRQKAALGACPHVLVGTPGKLAEAVEGDAELQRLLPNVRVAVLDEVDQLLEPTLVGLVGRVLARLPPGQRLLSSATFDAEAAAPELHALLGPAGATLRVVNLNRALAAAGALRHEYLLVPPLLKDYHFLHVLRAELARAEEDDLPGSLIVFFNHCRSCHFWHKLLTALGLPCAQVHSFVRQESRARNLAAFQAGRVRLLLATDLAARGLDVRAVRRVINYDFPARPVDYVHRAGRAARGGERGAVLSIVGPEELEALRAAEHRVGLRMREFRAGAEEEVLRGMGALDKLKRRLKVRFLVRGVDERFALLARRKAAFRRGLARAAEAANAPAPQ